VMSHSSTFATIANNEWNFEGFFNENAIFYINVLQIYIIHIYKVQKYSFLL
jgi:hypothetical protein